MFSILYIQHHEQILPVGYRASYGSVHFGIVENSVITESTLLLLDAVLVLKGLALLENEWSFEARVMEVYHVQRGLLCLAELMH